MYDLAADRCTALNHPPGRYCDSIDGGVGFSADGDIIGLRHLATAPPQVVSLNAATGAQRRTLLRSAVAPPGRPWRSVRLPSADGTRVHAWLAEPDATVFGGPPYPTILEVHGGPHWAFTETYDPRVQCWLDNGYAWLGVNYRGSTGFGAAFAEQIWGDLGHWELVDAVAARAWLVERGIARPDRILICGGSFGGYLALLALGRYPDLWAGGVAWVALGDLVATFDETSDAIRSAISGWMLGTPQDRPDAYERSSPITYAADVVAPVLIIQGRADSRAPAGQLTRYEERMRSLGKDIEVDWYDAGHQSISPRQWILLCERMLAFSRRALTSRTVTGTPRAVDGERR